MLRPGIAAFLLAGTLLTGCTYPVETASPPVATTPAPHAGGMISAADERAAEAGAQMLREGGNAVDAAFATLLALNVVEPQSSGIGGGGFIVFDNGSGSPITLDGRETAPSAATPEWFFKDGKAMSFPEARPGGKSTGVPGNLAMIAKLHAQYGSLDWPTIFAPAIKLAREGFEVTPRLHNTLAGAADIAGMTAEGKALYFPDGEVIAIGATLKNPAFANFLEKLAASGSTDAFYHGDNAAKIALAVQGATKNPAPLTESDISAYKAVERPAYCGSYREYKVCGMGPPSSGATTVFAILKQLEQFDLAAYGKDSPVAWHLFAESQRLAYADREKYLGDSDFVNVPMAGLMDGDYLTKRGSLISPDSTMESAPSGTPPGATLAYAPQPHDTEQGTTHFVTADANGMVVSETSTVESAFGSGLMVNGYFLNNELTDFSAIPAVDGDPVANRVNGGKRPRSSMSPTIVYGPDGKPRLAVGAAGGSTIIVQVAKAIMGVVDFGMSAQDAIAMGFEYSPGDTVYVEEGTSLEGMIPGLKELGHQDVKLMPGRLKANAVEWVDGKVYGAADPRSEGTKVTP